MLQCIQISVKKIGKNNSMIFTEKKSTLYTTVNNIKALTITDELLNSLPLCVDTDMNCFCINDCLSSTSHLNLMADLKMDVPSLTDARSRDIKGCAIIWGAEISIKNPLDVDSENRPEKKLI